MYLTCRFVTWEHADKLLRPQRYAVDSAVCAQHSALHLILAGDDVVPAVHYIHVLRVGGQGASVPVVPLDSWRHDPQHPRARLGDAVDAPVPPAEAVLELVGPLPQPRSHERQLVRAHVEPQDALGVAGEEVGVPPVPGERSPEVLVPAVVRDPVAAAAQDGAVADGVYALGLHVDDQDGVGVVREADDLAPVVRRQAAVPLPGALLEPSLLQDSDLLRGRVDLQNARGADGGDGNFRVCRDEGNDTRPTVESQNRINARVAPHERAVPLGVPVEPRPDVRRRLAPGVDPQHPRRARGDRVDVPVRPEVAAVVQPAPAAVAVVVVPRLLRGEGRHAGRVRLDLEDPPPLGAAGEGEATARRAVGGGRDLHSPEPLELAGELGPDEVYLGGGRVDPDDPPGVAGDAVDVPAARGGHSAEPLDGARGAEDEIRTTMRSQRLRRAPRDVGTSFSSDARQIGILPSPSVPSPSSSA
ncbi:hypothetical protein THAOC_33327 [Thalassiosira oceanica]|uniref:Uncharacterized protein n=1 Tax=Thalassiosira oceanica TaxID=159749 RepID=K0RG06_THAOC|nr:hypothetical protein THAOC_33327 [Thalassiosira oceanica]|eukprot:EJK47921.1 hypothetical protein THAOC_33327 [Thalassiosira oceanica]